MDNNEWFSVLELIVAIAIISIGISMSFLSLEIVDDQKFANKAKEMQDFIRNSKYYLITYKWDYVDVFLSSSGAVSKWDYKNTFLFSYVGNQDCLDNTELSSSNFYEKYIKVTWNDIPKSLSFSWYSSTGITIVGFKQKTVQSFESITSTGGVFDIQSTDSDLYKFDVFDDSKKCAHIFLKKLNKVTAEYFIRSIILNKIQTNSNEGSIKISFQKNLSHDISTGSGYLTKVFFQDITLILGKWRNTYGNIIILNR
jgi:hypothetical protein